jgi:copper chaperone CopZ
LPRNENEQLQRKESPVSNLNLTVEGITCAGCALDIETVFGNEEGVLKAAVDYSACRYQKIYPTETSEERIYGALKRIGLKILKRR